MVGKVQCGDPESNFESLPSEVHLAKLWDTTSRLIQEIWLARWTFIPSGYLSWILLLGMHTWARSPIPQDSRAVLWWRILIKTSLPLTPEVSSSGQVPPGFGET